MSSILDIVLIDADSVHSNYAGRVFKTKGAQGYLEVCRDSELMAIEVGDTFVGHIFPVFLDQTIFPPDVGQCLVLQMSLGEVHIMRMEVQ
jgi:hypothetical protein